MGKIKMLWKIVTHDGFVFMVLSKHHLTDSFSDDTKGQSWADVWLDRYKQELDEQGLFHAKNSIVLRVEQVLIQGSI